MMALELEDRARARGAPIYATIEGYASTCDAYHRVQMDPDGEQIVKLHERRDRQVGPRARGDRLHQLSRHLDAAERRDRVALHAPRVRHARRAHSGLVDQVDDRPSAGRQRRRRASSPRRSRCRAGSCRRRSTRPSPDPALRSRFHPQRGPRRVAGRGALQLPRLRIEEQRARPRHEPMDDVAIAGAGPAGALAATILATGRPARQHVRSRAISPSQALRRHAESRRAGGDSADTLDVTSLHRAAAIRSTACC